MNSSIDLWHYQLPESEKHLLLNGGRNPGKDMQILQCLCYVLEKCHKDSFHHKMTNSGPLREEKFVSLMLVVHA